MHLPAVFPDAFAVEWGHDQYGTFQSFAVGNVVQRMRWIPPGSFLMGSPESEVGRFDDELQHKVDITSGFWLGETPVTQALWEAVMEANPSIFKNFENPVEMVSWNRCQTFIKRLNEHIDGLKGRLPAEEEWEYACRAGTTTATWLGDLLIEQDDRAPQLETLAWYSRNAGATSHSVAQKAANPWGLYDMLGNVWEWCVDSYTRYDTMQNPEGSIRGSRRVLRGGSWNSIATTIRSASRDEYRPSRFSANFGFRLARSATPKP